jgi:tRNA modification GTPase
MHSPLGLYTTDDRIAALATPWGTAALAVVRTSGAGSAEALAPAFSDPDALLSAPSGSLHHGILTDPESKEPVDEVVLGVFRAPNGYTGEESVEIYCHGGIPAVQAVLDLLFRLGFRQAEPGEFSFRAFFNGKLDLTRAEAVHEIITAKTRKAHSLALHRLAGSVEKRINEAKRLIAETLAAVEVRLDYPEEDAEDGPLPAKNIDGSAEILRKLLSTYKEGRLYQEGVRIALAGRTNAGKSSLFNLFLREERSIVSDLHGTTRDYIEALVTIRGIPVRLYDTAGLRTAEDPIEHEGVLRSRRIIENCLLVIYLLDASAGSSPEDEATIAALGDKAVPVWNKIDCNPELPEDGRLRLSASTAEGFGELSELLGGRLTKGAVSGENEAVIDSERQKNLLETCLRALERFNGSLAAGMPLDIVAQDLQEALRALGEITGEVTTEEMLTLMFSRFCVGK